MLLTALMYSYIISVIREHVYIIYMLTNKKDQIKENLHMFVYLCSLWNSQVSTLKCQLKQTFHKRKQIYLKRIIIYLTVAVHGIYHVVSITSMTDARNQSPLQPNSDFIRLLECHNTVSSNCIPCTRCSTLFEVCLISCALRGIMYHTIVCF